MDFALVFIRTDSEIASSTVMVDAYNVAEKEGLPVSWTSVVDSPVVHSSKGDRVYVIENFEGPIFDRLVEKGARIFGPLVVEYCVRRRQPLPKYDHPVHNLTFSKIVVCCTSVPKTQRCMTHRLVQNMGGHVMKDFTSAVTHLVAGEPGTAKYNVAYRLGVPVVTREWVSRAWAASSANQASCISALPDVSKFTCPIFQGCTICATGVPADHRKKICDLVTSHGGVYSGELNMKTCTHLLVDEPKGEKFQFAQRWNILCVRSQWCFDSVKAGYYLPDKEYKLDVVNKPSTITPNLTHIDNSCMTSQLEKTLPHPDRSQVPVVKASVAQEREYILNNYTLSREDLHIPMTKSKHCLDGCVVLILCGDCYQEDALRRICNLGGATRLSMYDDLVTHVIVCPSVKMEDLDSVFLASKSGTCFVTAGWLVDSFRNGRRQAEAMYQALQVKSKSVDKPSLPQPALTASSNMQDVDLDFQSIYNGNSTASCHNKAKPFHSVLFFMDSTSLWTPDTCAGIINSMGGQLVQNLSDAHYIIHNHIQKSSDPHCVTEFWLEACQTAWAVVDPCLSQLYTPFFKTSSTMPLQSCSITVANISSIPLRGVTFLVQCLGAIIVDNGGTLEPQHGVTHIVSQSVDEHLGKLASKLGVPIVSPEWLFNCAARGAQVDHKVYVVNQAQPPTKWPGVVPDSAFFHIHRHNTHEVPVVRATWRPTFELDEALNQLRSPQNGVLNQTASKPIHSPLDEKLLGGLQLANKAIRPSFPAFTPVTSSTLVPLNAHTAEVTPQPEENLDCAMHPAVTPDSTKSLQKQLEQIMIASKSAKKEDREPASRLNRKTSCLSGIGLRRKLRFSNKFSDTQSAIDPTQTGAFDFNTDHSQGECISYEDPTKSERERILAHIRGGATSTMDIPSNSSVTALDPTQSACPAVRPGLPVFPPGLHTGRLSLPSTEPIHPLPMLQPSELCFLVTALDQHEKADYSALIENLGGRVLDVRLFSSECTHVLVGTPSRGEKYLASVAAGKWVLRKSYMEACRQAGTFVNEALFEWGTEDQPSKLSLAARCWRIKVDEQRMKSQPTGAFVGWKVVLLVEKSRYAGLRKILEAGSAVVVTMNSQACNELSGVTHAFLDTSKVSISSDDLTNLVQLGVLCLRPEYIAEYLMQDPPPPPSRYFISEVLPLLGRLAGSRDIMASRRRPNVPDHWAPVPKRACLEDN